MGVPPSPDGEFHTVIQKVNSIHLVNAARACIPLFWKSTHPPTKFLCYAKVDGILNMGQITATLNHTEETFRLGLLFNSKK